MALNTSTRKPKKAKPTEAEEAAALQQHLLAVGLTSVEDYRAWCSEQGFSLSTRKSRLQREQEVLTVKRALADSRLSQKKREQRSFRATLEAVFSGQLHERDVTSPDLRVICDACLNLQASNFVRKAFRELLMHVGETTDLIQVIPVISQYGLGRGNSYLGGLLAMAHHAQDWIRPVTDWKPTSHNVDRQFQSLSRHLFARWPVPAFMDSVWFQGTAAEARDEQQWFVHLGRGENIRTARIPIAYTRRMSHHFMQAPNDYTIEEALRWGQVRAMGGSARLVKVLLATRLRTDYQHADFWTSVIQFFIDNPMLDLAHAGPIVDYLQHEKFTQQEVIEGYRVKYVDPPQPNLTMKGRTVDALLRNVEAWHRKLARIPQTAVDWMPSGISGFHFVEGAEAGGNARIWTITELVSSSALIAEGRKMKHCVASYANSCKQGTCSIWALELQTWEGHSKVLTLEVTNNTRTLVQARGKCNVLPTQKERGILYRWAEQAGLQLAKWV